MGCWLELTVRNWANAALLVVLVHTASLAGYGKVAGTVGDAQGNPLPGANVTMTIGTTVVGSSADERGRFFVLNVAPGSYTVQASYVGFQPLKQTGIQVRNDLTATLEFRLEKQEIEAAAVTVVAQRPLVERTLTASRSTIDASELNNTMPVGTVQELIDTAPSSFRGFVRGGRKADTKYLLDGIDISDTYFRGGEGRDVYSPYTSLVRSNPQEYTSVDISAGAVQSVDILSGTFNAEYDAASAGVIDISTREGGQRYSGRVFFRFSPGVRNAGPDLYANARTVDGAQISSDLELYLAERDGLLSATDDSGNPDDTKRAKGAQYSFAQSDIAKLGYGDDPRLETEFSFGGPLSRNTTFFFTTHLVNDRGHLVNMRNRSIRYSLKLAHALGTDRKLVANLVVDDGGKWGGWVNRNFNGKYKFFPEGAIGHKKLGLLGYLSWTHFTAPESFYNVKISRLQRNSEFGFSDDDGDGRSSRNEDGDFLIIRSAEQAEKYLGVGGSGVRSDGTLSFFSPNPGNDQSFVSSIGSNQYRYAQPGFYYEDLERNVTQLKADLTRQLNFNHQLKTGILLRQHLVSQFQQLTTVRITYDPVFPYAQTDYERNPREFAAYLQDRIEYKGAIVNAGIRVDGLDVDARQFDDFFRPARQETLKNGQIVRRQVRSKTVDTRWFWQPRLGISHPISENAAIYYSWGRFYSPPPFSQLYEGYGFFTNPSLPRVSDVERAPPKSTAYEMGVQYSFSRHYLLDATTYYRDIENYGDIGYVIRPAAGTGFGRYDLVTSFGYADSRGFEISLKRPSGPVSGRVNYAFSYIKTSFRDEAASPFPDKTSYSSVADGDANIPFDDRDTFNSYEQNVTGGGGSSDNLGGGYDRAHQLSVTLKANLAWSTDLALISTAESGFFYRLEATGTDARNRESDRAPWNLRTEARASRPFKVGRYALSGFVEVRNLFDRKNVIAYDRYNIQSQVLWEDRQDPTGDLNRPYAGNSGQPIYGDPRQWSLGFTVDY